MGDRNACRTPREAIILAVVSEGGGRYGGLKVEGEAAARSVGHGCVPELLLRSLVVSYKRGPHMSAYAA